MVFNGGSTYLNTCLGSFENDDPPDGFALRSRGCSADVSTGLGDGFAEGLTADDSSAIGVECIC